MPFVLYLNACLEVGVLCADWIFETNLVFVLQHIMYYILQKIFCVASHKKCIKHVVMVTISTH